MTLILAIECDNESNFEDNIGLFYVCGILLRRVGLLTFRSCETCRLVYYGLIKIRITKNCLRSLAYVHTVTLVVKNLVKELILLKCLMRTIHMLIIANICFLLCFISYCLTNTDTQL